MKQLADYLTKIMLRNGIVSQDEYSVTAFGLETLMLKIMHFAVSVFIGLIFGKAVEMIVFYLFYMVLRTYAGGYHAKNNIRCFISSCVIAVAAACFWRFVVIPSPAWVVAAFLAAAVPVIWLLSPVEATNKPLDCDEERVYKKRARIVLAIETAAIIALLALGIADLALAGATTLIVIAIMLVFGRILLKKMSAAVD